MKSKKVYWLQEMYSISPVHLHAVRATIDENPCPGYIITGTTGQKHRDSLEISWLTPSPGWNSIDDLFIGLGIIKETLGERGLDPTVHGPLVTL
jgi:hypothetical protein